MPQYRNAPITEAVISLQTRLPDEVSRLSLADIGDGLAAKFPNKGSVKSAHFELTLSASEAPGATASGKDSGYLFHSADENRFVQFRLDGFAFSLLAPYQSWQSFRGEVEPVWTRYREIARPDSITAVSLKYINRFDIPLPISDFKDFFRTSPEVSPDLPQGLAGFFM